MSSSIPENVPISQNFVVPINNPITNISNDDLKKINKKILIIYLANKIEEKSLEKLEEPGQPNIQTIVTKDERWFGKWTDHSILNNIAFKRRLLLVPKVLLRYVNREKNIVEGVIVIDSDQDLKDDYQLIIPVDVLSENVDPEDKVGSTILSLLPYVTEYNLETVTELVRSSNLLSIDLLKDKNLAHNLSKSLRVPPTTYPSKPMIIMSRVVGDCYVLVPDTKLTGELESANIKLESFFEGYKTKSVDEIITKVIIYPFNEIDPDIDDSIKVLQNLLYLKQNGLDVSKHIGDIFSKKSSRMVLSYPYFVQNPDLLKDNQPKVSTWIEDLSDQEIADFITTYRKSTINVYGCLGDAPFGYNLRGRKIADEKLDSINNKQISRAYIPPPLDINSQWVLSVSNVDKWSESVSPRLLPISDNIIMKTVFISDTFPVIDLTNTIILSRGIYHSLIKKRDYSDNYLAYRLLIDHEYDTLDPSTGKPLQVPTQESIQNKYRDIMTKLELIFTPSIGDFDTGVVKDAQIIDNGNLTLNMLGIDIQAAIKKQNNVILLVNTNDLDIFQTVANGHYQAILKWNSGYQVEVLESGIYRLFVPLSPGPLDKKKYKDLNTPDIYIIYGELSSFINNELPQLRACYGFITEDQEKPDIFGTSSFLLSTGRYGGVADIPKYIFMFPDSDYNSVLEDYAYNDPVKPGYIGDIRDTYKKIALTLDRKLALYLDITYLLRRSPPSGPLF